MKGTAADLSIEENLALAYRRGKTRSLRWGIHRSERENYKERLKLLDLGVGEPFKIQGWIVVRWSTPSFNFAHGYIAKAKTVVVG